MTKASNGAQEYVDRLMADWPAPTPEQNRRIAAIFNG